jgi:hypothetical protein
MKLYVRASDGNYPDSISFDGKIYGKSYNCSFKLYGNAPARFPEHKNTRFAEQGKYYQLSSGNPIVYDSGTGSPVSLSYLAVYSDGEIGYFLKSGDKYKFYSTQLRLQGNKIVYNVPKLDKDNSDIKLPKSNGLMLDKDSSTNSLKLDNNPDKYKL